MSARPDYQLTEIGEIPGDWEVKRLDEIASEFVSGGTPSTSNPEYWDGNIPWMRSAWISKRFVHAGEKYISEKGLKNSATNVVPSGNLLVATRVCIGNVALNKIDIAISQDLTGVVIKKQKADPEYIYWVLKNSENRIRQLVQGSTIGGLLRNDLKRLAIPLPSLPEQRKIVSILSTLDESSQKTDEIITKTQQLKKGLMQQLLAKGIGHTRFRQTEIGEIPEEWQVKRLDEVTYDVRGGASLKPEDFREHGFPVLHKGDIRPDDMLVIQERNPFCSEEFAKSHESSVVNDSFLVVTLRDLVPTAPAVGLMAHSNGTYLLAQGAYGFHCDEKQVDSRFLVYLSNSSRYRRCMRSISVGSTQVHIRTSEFFETKLPVPPLDEQRRISSILHSVSTKTRNDANDRESLERLKRGLMHDLLRGKVRVKVS
jgi:type I restriction enzyme S subunit